MSKKVDINGKIVLRVTATRINLPDTIDINDEEALSAWVRQWLMNNGNYHVTGTNEVEVWDVTESN